MNNVSEHEDLRIRRTQKLLWEALIALMARQDFEAISVKDICDRAMIHRTTFYKHYKDKYDLLMHGMQAMHNELRKAHEGEQQASSRPFLTVFQHVAEHIDFYTLMLCGNGIGTFYTLLREYLAETAQQQLLKLQQRGREFAVPLPLIAQFWAGAIISTTAWWLENRCPYSPEQMSGYMDIVLADTPLDFLKK